MRSISIKPPPDPRSYSFNKESTLLAKGISSGRILSLSLETKKDIVTGVSSASSTSLVPCESVCILSSVKSTLKGTLVDTIKLSAKTIPKTRVTPIAENSQT